MGAGEQMRGRPQLFMEQKTESKGKECEHQLIKCCLGMSDSLIINESQGTLETPLLDNQDCYRDFGSELDLNISPGFWRCMKA